MLVIGIFYSVSFLVVGAVFAIVGIIFYFKFKKVSPENAQVNKWRIALSIFIIFTTFMIRGITNLVTVILEGDETMRLQWLENDSLALVILLSIYYIVVDVIPSVYLAFSIKMVTSQYMKRYMSQNTKKDNTLQKKLSFGEDTFKEDSLVENSETYETSKETLDNDGDNNEASHLSHSLNR